MENILIERTPKSPLVNFDFEKGLFEITGRSFPDSPDKFYLPLIKAVKDYLVTEPQNPLIFRIKFEWFNTPTSKHLLHLLKEFEAYRHKVATRIEWYYEEGDYEMEEAGQDYSSLLELEFKIIEMEE